MPHLAGISIKQFLDIKDFSSGLLINSKFHGEDEDMAPNHAEPLNKVVLVRGAKNSKVKTLQKFFTFLHDYLLSDVKCAMKRNAIPEPDNAKREISVNLCVSMGSDEYRQYEIRVFYSLLGGKVCLMERIIEYKEHEKPNETLLRTGDEVFLLNQEDGEYKKAAKLNSETMSMFTAQFDNSILTDADLELGRHLMSYSPFGFDCSEWASSISFGNPVPMLTNDGSNISRVAAYWRKKDLARYDRIAGNTQGHYISSKQNGGAWELDFTVLGSQSTSVSFYNVPKANIKLYAMKLMLMNAELYGNICILYPDRKQSHWEIEHYLNTLEIMSQLELDSQDAQVWVLTETEYAFAGTTISTVKI